MSNGATMLACSGYFLGCPQPRLTRASKSKGAEGDLALDVFIKGISTGGAIVWSVSTRGTSTEDAFA